MLGRFDGAYAKFRRGTRYYGSTCYLTHARAKRRLRAQTAALPPPPGDISLFSLQALRIARHPSRGPIAPTP